MIGVDFETRSPVPISAGAYRYFDHPGTGVYMLAWKPAGEEPQIWLPGDPRPERLVEHINDGLPLEAWGAQFERLCFEYIMHEHGWPVPKLEQWRCTAARARAHGLPGKLELAARCMGIEQQKGSDGARLIRQYSATNTPWEDIPEEDQDLFIGYGLQDTRTEAGIGECLRELTDDEWAEYHENERICDRGVPVNLEFAEAAVALADEVLDDVDDQIRTLTGGAVTSCRARKARDEWLLPQLDEEQLKAVTVYKTTKDPETGESVTNKKVSFDQDHRDALELLEPAEPVREWLWLMNEAGGATISKYKAAVARSLDYGDWDRVPGVLMFNGAGQTGRFSSMGMQLHNLRRDSIDDPDPIIHQIIDGTYDAAQGITTTLARLVRALVCSPRGLSWYDFSAIEGRVAPWLADSPAGEAKLDVFRRGEDPYLHAAAGIYGIPYEQLSKASPERQPGKVAELALQFLGGVGALQVMGRNYGVHFTEEEAEQVRDGWRRANPWAREFGNQLEAATMRALLYPGEWHTAGRVAYAFDGVEWLWCRLPSGRIIAYFRPALEEIETPWGDARMSVTAVWGSRRPKVGEEWPRRALHAGILIENITQAAAADLLREAIMRCRGELDVVLHVHDEIIVEGLDLHERLGEIMLDASDWAEGLPLAGEGGTGYRYGK